MNTFIELLKVLLSWPVAVLIICLIFFFKFKDAINAFLKNIKSIKMPYGAEVQIQTSPDEPKKQGGRFITPEEEEKLAVGIRNLLAMDQLNQQQKQQLEKDVEKAYNFAKHWKFSYLNLFYVYTTKQVLLWFSQVSQTTKDIYHSQWQILIPDERQRNIILDVLHNNYMLETLDNFNYKITLHGYEFLQFIGYIPQKPNP